MKTPEQPLRALMTVEQLWQPVPGGSATYIRELARSLVASGAVDLTGVSARGKHPTGALLPPEMPVHASALPRPALYEAWSRLRRPRVPRGGVAGADGRGYDVIHATTWAVPPRSAPLVVTVHDVAFLRNPEHFTGRGVAFFRRALDIVRAEADLVIVPSETTKEDCVASGIDPRRIRVIHHGTIPQSVSAHDIHRFRQDHRIQRDFVLWCGTLEPRKNLPALLSAFASMVAAEKARGSEPGLDLVLVGPDGWGDTSRQVAQALAALPEDRVHWLGRLDDHELQVAYGASRVFCFPSLWEGFGMPVLEAMAHGTPVVTSRDSAMSEVAGGGALLVDPRSPEAIAEALVRAAGPEHERLSLAASSNAAAYTWEASAEKHVEVYREAAATARQSGFGRRRSRSAPPSALQPPRTSVTPPDSTPRTVAVRAVVVSWNGAHLLPECLDSLLQQDFDGRLEIVVVDNASTDDTAILLERDYPQVTVRTTSENLGFAGGANRALTDLDHVDHVFLLNNDATVERDAVRRLVEHLESPGHSRVGAATSRIVLAEGGEEPDRINSTGNVLLARGSAADRDWLAPIGTESTDLEVFGFCGGAALLRAEMLEDVGIFDAGLFLYYEDTDLSWRMRAEGWDIHYVATAVAHHRHAATSDVTSPLFRYYNTRNSLLVFARHAPARAVVGSLVRQTAAWIRSCVVRSEPQGVRRARGRALLAFAAATPATVRTRRATWAGRTALRREVFRSGVLGP